jgi:curved DNA-binding protein CbpA
VSGGVSVAAGLANAPRKTWRRHGFLPDYYAILGLRSDADTARIKAAYRILVKKFHPDVSAAIPGADQRIRDINDAYEILVNQATRAEYDLEIGRQRAATRARFWRSFAAGAVVFGFTVGAGILVAPLIGAPPRREAPATNPRDVSESEAKQRNLASAQTTRDVLITSSDPRAVSGRSPALPNEVVPPSGPGDLLAQWERSIEEGRPERPAQTASHDGQHVPRDKPMPAERIEPTVRSAPEPAMLPERGSRDLKRPKLPLESRSPQRSSALAAEPPPKAANWTSYYNRRFGFALRYPAGVFTEAVGDASSGDNLLLWSDARRATLWISASPLGAGSSIAAYRRSLIAERFVGATFDYAPQRENWFILSGVVGGEMFYERVTFSCDRRSVHHWLIVYPVTERAFFDEIVEEIHSSYRYDINGRAHCGGPNGGVRRRASLLDGEDSSGSIPR